MVRLTAIPREMNVLVAVIEPKSNPVTVTSLVTNMDPEPGLKQEPYFSQTLNMAIGDELLVPENGDSLIIPLQIGFSYTNEDRHKNGEDFSSQVKIQLKESQKDFTFSRCEADINSENFDLNCEPYASGNLSKVGISKFETTETYVFGPALEISQLSISGREEVFSVRDIPESYVFKDNGYAYGSCPFAYFGFENGSEKLAGRVLVGANAVDKKMTEQIKVPSGAKTFVLKELEPEISYISAITAILKNGERKSLISSDIVLKPRTQIELQIPPSSVSIEISGHYELLN